jgi:hypothetical protein
VQLQKQRERNDDAKSYSLLCLESRFKSSNVSMQVAPQGCDVMDTPNPNKSLVCRFGHCHWITGYKAEKCHSLIPTLRYTMERVHDDTDMDVEEMQAAPPCWTVSSSTLSSSFTNSQQDVAEIEQRNHHHNNGRNELSLSFSTLHISSPLPPPPPQ